MNKKTVGKIFNILLIVGLVLLIIPQTRQPIQVGVHRVLGIFSPSFKSSKEGEIFSNYNWILHNDFGDTVNVLDFQDKVIVINFWATWCPPCIAEMPSLEKLYLNYNQEVLFLFITSENFEVTTKFKQKHDYQFPVFNTLSNVPSEFKVSSIPRTFIIDKNGRIVVDKSGTANWFSESFQEKLQILINQ